MKSKRFPSRLNLGLKVSNSFKKRGFFDESGFTDPSFRGEKTGRGRT
jgi:hypothetical protein